MNNNKYFSKFGPPPQPKSCQINPARHTVPDVTLMFDSDDSLMWTPGLKPASYIGRYSSKVRATVPSQKRQLDIENAAIVEPVRDVYQRNKDSQDAGSNINNQVCLPKQTVRNGNYNPEIYISPVSSVENLPQLEKIDIKTVNKCDSKQRTNNLVFNGNSFINEHSSRSNLNRKEKLTSSCSTVNIMKYHGYNQNHYLPSENALENTNQSADNPFPIQSTEDKLSNLQQLPSRSPVLHAKEVSLLSVDSPSEQKIDENVLKVLEEQKFQIMCLHSILEKVLANQDKVIGPSSAVLHKDNVHVRDSQLDETSKKVAIVQTSFTDTKPETRTVSINTDLTMNEITTLIENEKKYRPFRSVSDNQCKVPSSATSPRKNSYRETNPVSELQQEMTQNALCHKDELLTLRDIGTVLEDLSSEATMDINIPDYCEECPEKNADEHYDVEEAESETEESDRQAVYQNILINIHQILQPKENHSTYMEENDRPKSVESTERDTHIEQIEHQLQNYGISFLDAATLKDKRKPQLHTRFVQGLPSFFSLCQSNLKGLDSTVALQYQRTAAYIPSYGQSPKATGPRNLSRSIFMNKTQIGYQHENSVSTRQFLGKFGIQE